MIRINLLPQKRKRVEGASSGELWVLVALGVVVLEVIGLFVFHGYKEEQLQAQVEQNRKVQAEIDASKRKVANHEQVKKELEALRAREEAIEQLQSARSGPTAVMLEVSKVLTPGRGPSLDPEKLAQIRKENPLAVYNPAWDPRRLWLTSFKEKSRTVQITGTARDGEDVSEFARRLNLSDYFEDVLLKPGRQDKREGLEVVTFALEAKVNY